MIIVVLFNPGHSMILGKMGSSATSAGNAEIAGWLRADIFMSFSCRSSATAQLTQTETRSVPALLVGDPAHGRGVETR